MKPDICIYHGNCADGFGAAWAVWRRWGDAVEYVPGVYGAEPPDVRDKHVLMVDFSYKRPVLDAMLQTAASIIILDHHKTAEADLAAFRVVFCGDAKFRLDDAEHGLRDLAELQRPPCLAEFDMNRSGAVMTWEATHKTPVPALLYYVQDRDLWRFSLHGSREVAAVVFSHPYDFRAWNSLATEVEHNRDSVIAEGRAIERKHHKDISELLQQTRRTMRIGGYDVPVANLPYTMASDAAGLMAEGQPFAACYFDRNDGQRVFSLRSREPDGVDVSEVARSYGGGGHKNAAGFQAPLGWEGDPLLSERETPWTAGPWTVRRAVEHCGKAYGPLEIHGRDSVQRTGSGGAVSWSDALLTFSGLDDDEANARLIAAAPELYEACRQAAELFEDDESIAQVLLSALAKARGEATP